MFRYYLVLINFGWYLKGYWVSIPSPSQWCFPFSSVFAVLCVLKRCFRCLSCRFRALFDFTHLQGRKTGISCSSWQAEQPAWCFVPRYAGEGNTGADHRTTGTGNKRTFLPCRPNWIFHIFPHCFNTTHTFSTSLCTGKAQVTSMDALGDSCEKIMTDGDVMTDKSCEKSYVGVGLWIIIRK